MDFSKYVDTLQQLTRDVTLASNQYEIISEQIKEFQDNLDNEHEIALLLTNFGQSITMSVTRIGFYDPSLICYYGFVNGKECKLIQHISQISFLLVAVQKEDPDKPPRRIGFN